MRTAFNKGLHRCVDCGRPTEIVAMSTLEGNIFWPMCKRCQDETNKLNHGLKYITLEEAKLLLVKSKL